MRTLQPIPHEEGERLLDAATSFVRYHDELLDGIDWEEWTHRAHPGAGSVVRLSLRGEDLGYYHLR